MSRTILTTASGRAVDLLNPSPSDIDFADIAEHLAKENRYNGATPWRAYSVAEHLARGTDAIFAWAVENAADPAVPDADLCAAYFLLHDCPEAYLKDDPTPKKRALDAIAEANFGTLAGSITAAFGMLTDRFDVAIAAAAGLPWPPTEAIAAAVHRFDRIMLVTEWRDLMPGWMPSPPEERPLAAMRITPWGWEVAHAKLMRRFRRFLPALRPGFDQTRGAWEFPDGTPLKNAADD